MRFKGTPDDRHDKDSLRYTGSSFQSFGAASKKKEYRQHASFERELESRVVSDEDLSCCLRGMYVTLCRTVSMFDNVNLVNVIANTHQQHD